MRTNLSWSFRRISVFADFYFTCLCLVKNFYKDLWTPLCPHSLDNPILQQLPTATSTWRLLCLSSTLYSTPGYVAVMHRKCALLLFVRLWFQSALHGASQSPPTPLPPFLSHVVSVNRSPLKYMSVSTQWGHLGGSDQATLSPEGHTATYCWKERHEDSTVFVIHPVFRSEAGSVDQRLHVPLPGPRGVRRTVILCHLDPSVLVTPCLEYSDFLAWRGVWKDFLLDYLWRLVMGNAAAGGLEQESAEHSVGGTSAMSDPVPTLQKKQPAPSLPMPPEEELEMRFNAVLVSRFRVKKKKKKGGNWTNTSFIWSQTLGTYCLRQSLIKKKKKNLCYVTKRL